MAMISHSHKFIYVSGGKCATGAIAGILQRNSNLTFFEPANTNSEWWQKYNKHMPARMIQKFVGKEVWDQYFKFTFVRNTYSWIVSSFFFMVKIGMLPKPPKGIMSIKSFKQVLNYYQTPAGRRYDDLSPVRSQKTFISDKNGNVMVDMIGHFESLQEDFDQICSRLSLPQRTLAHCNPSPSRIPWIEQYRQNKEAQEFVYHHWKQDIDYFKFRLDI